MFNKQFWLRILFEYRMIVIYAGLFVLGLILMWIVSGLSRPQLLSAPTPAVFVPGNK